MKKNLYICNGILEQIKEDYTCKTIISKESLLEFAKEQDKEFERKYPFCSHKNIVTNMVLECLEYNTDTSAGHPTSEGDDIVRYSEETQRVKGKEP